MSSSSIHDEMLTSTVLYSGCLFFYEIDEPFLIMCFGRLIFKFLLKTKYQNWDT